MPVRIVFWMILNRLDLDWPVVEGRVIDIATFEMIVGAGTNPMDDFATPSLDGAQRAAVRGDGRDLRTELSVQALFGSAPEDAQRFVHLVDPDLHSVAHVANLINGYAEGIAAVGRIRVIAANVQIHP